MWGEEDSNLRSLRQQIYSLPHLAALESPLKVGADGRTRTADRLITNQLLYQLSYIGLKSRNIKNLKYKNKKTALFLKKGLQKYYCIFNYQNFFGVSVKKV